jgi:hypothetical protein
MSGKKKAPVTPPSPEHIEAAAKTPSIKQLVWLADAFHRVGSRGSVVTQMPQLVVGEVAGKGYRKFNLPINTALECDSMRVGKREGIIFRFRPKQRIERKSSRGDMELIEAIELSWNDVCNLFLSLADDIEQRIRDVRHYEVKIAALDTDIRRLILKNAQMHPIITEGFKRAQDVAKNQANDDALEHIEGFGTF